MKFSPAMVRVQPGDIVVFRNADLVPHNVTERRDHLVDSGMIKPTESWRFSAAQKGAFNYQCIYHPDMTGLIVVGEAAESSAMSTLPEADLCGGP